MCICLTGKGMLWRAGVVAALVLHCGDASAFMQAGCSINHALRLQLASEQGLASWRQAPRVRQACRVRHTKPAADGSARRPVQLSASADPLLTPFIALLLPSVFMPGILLSSPVTWYILLQFGVLCLFKSISAVGKNVDRKVCTRKNDILSFLKGAADKHDASIALCTQCVH